MYHFFISLTLRQEFSEAAENQPCPCQPAHDAGRRSDVFRAGGKICEDKGQQVKAGCHEEKKEENQAVKK
jgi:hypothetical protein